jgi:L-threonylcarbamoyladenylate synthase
LALIEAVGAPLVAPSANRSGYVSPTSAEHVRGVWSEADVFVLDGGACEVGLESTVVAVGDDGLRVLRPGVIGAEELSRVAGRPVLEGAERGGVAASPGLIGAHYQPRARVVLVQTPEDGRAHVGEAKVVWLGPPGVGTDALGQHESLAMPGEAGEYARHLYAMLRRADVMGASAIVVCVPDGAGAIWDAVRERLGRAAASR